MGSSHRKPISHLTITSHPKTGSDRKKIKKSSRRNSSYRCGTSHRADHEAIRATRPEAASRYQAMWAVTR
jgi:hypothetical protein